MLYLIEQYGDKGRKYLKIGSSGDIDKRIKQYDTHCAEFKILDTFQGSGEQEHMLQKLLIKYVFKNEFMIYDKFIIETWNIYKTLYEKISQMYENKLKEKDKKIFKMEDEQEELIKQVEKYKTLANHYKILQEDILK